MSHYYGLDGVLHAEVPNASKPGFMRPTTSADARKWGWLPSVTTCLSEISKPMVNDWRVRQGIIAAMEMDYSEYQLFTNRDALVAEVMEKSNAYVEYAQQAGIAIHAAIADIIHNLDTPLSVRDFHARDIAEAALLWAADTGFTFSESERTFVNQGLGYAGTIDLLGHFCGEPCIVDVKSRDGLDELGTTKAYYPDQALQLSGYALGIERPELLRVSILVDRQKVGLCDMKVWKAPEVAKYDKAWLHLKDYVLAVKGLGR